MAGDCAFNSVANGVILEKTPFEDVYIPPAAGDSGLAVGAAFYVYHQVLNQSRSFVMNHAYWGPQFKREQIRQSLGSKGIEDQGLRIAELSDEEVVRVRASGDAEGKGSGW